MRTFLMTLLALLSVFESVSAQKILKIYAREDPNSERTIESELKHYGDEAYQADSLIVSGFLFPEEFSLLSKLCQLGNLKGLNLSKCVVKDNTIPDYAFNPNNVNSADGEYVSHLEYISLPQELHTIGERAFSNTNLRSIEIKRGIINISKGVFDGCNQLKQVTVRQPIPIPRLGEELSSLSHKVTVYIPQGSKSLYEESESWKGINIVESEDAFRIRSLTINAGGLREALGTDIYRVDSLKVYGSVNRNDVTELAKSVKIGLLTGFDLSECTAVGDAIRLGGFRAHRDLMYARIPNNVEVIYGNAFNTTSLREIILPPSLKIIYSRAFCNCRLVRGELRIPEGTQYVDDNSFNGDFQLRNIYLPSTLDSIATGSFDISMPSLGERGKPDCNLYVNRMTPPKTALWQDGFCYSPFAFDGYEEWTMSGYRLYVPIGAKENYKKALFWQDFPEIIETAELTGSSTDIQAVKNISDNGLTEVYTLSGRLISKGKAMPRLTKGLYIVKSAGTTRKVQISE